MKVFSIFLLVTVSCKAGVRETDVSEPNFIKSESGTMLTFTMGEEGRGYCVLKMSEDNPSAHQLITINGGLSRRQVGQALRYMGYAEHVVAAGTTVIGGIVTGKLLKGKIGDQAWEVLSEADGKAGSLVLDLLRKPAIGGAIAIVGILHGGKIAYRVIRGKQEGETTEAQVLGAFPGGLILGPLVEFFRRGSRIEKAVSEYTALRFSDKKVSKIIDKIADMEGKFPESCDYLN